uniref:Solute carrier family 35 member G1-like n=1 Tax=Saccoglossus kowalevskii TaxID=10224 RepID=A0ABM0MZZ5_SACKO|nr:PREDICTED: solute carrier family 35 member G1-like [Saccoglossus kowalevskii]
MTTSTSVDSSLIGAGVALIEALLASMVFVSSRKIGKEMNFLAILFYYSICGIVTTLSLLYILDAFSLPASLNEGIFLGLVGFFGFVGQLFLTSSLQCEKAVNVAIVRTMDIVFSYVLQYMWLGQKSEWSALGGAILVMISSAGIVIRQTYYGKKNKAEL